MKGDLVAVGLAAFGAYSTGLGLFMLIAPGAFFESLGPFGTRNDHYIHDAATFELPLGLMLLAAIRWPSWRVPALAFATVHWALHTLSHLVDVDDADPEWIGIFEFIALALGTTLLAAIFVRAVHEQRDAEP